MHLVDYHVHPGYSVDAEPESVRQFCERAVLLNISEICFTTHFECDPIRKHIDWQVRLNNRMVPMDQWDWIEHYHEEIKGAQEEYKGALKVKVGIEVGYDLGLEKIIHKLVSSYPWDYVLGSIHCLEHQAISSSKESAGYFPGRSWEEVCINYYRVLKEAVLSGLFDCIGHLDIYRRHGCQYLGEVPTCELELAREVLKIIAKQGIGLEVNSSGLRKGGQCFPSDKILKLAQECGVKIFTVGSDAHRVKDLGVGIRDALETLFKLGLCCYTYKNRKATKLPE